ncbi:MAG: hypothetical protein K2J99_10210 [Lachnospiraceae bacterium]|nr:hypothetical protein [Lachnospiraceae bacterium]
MDSKVTMLAVGQGAMNLIEIYEYINGQRVLVNLSLIDCGSIDGHPYSKAACERALDYAAGKMRERYGQGEYLLLDNLLITHGDGDHWNLLDCLLQKVIGAGVALIIKNQYSGWLRVEEKDGFKEIYYMNAIDKIYRYEKNYYEEFEIELEVSYICEDEDIIQQVNLEYEYEDNYIAVCWNPQYFNIIVSDETEAENKLSIACDSENYIIKTKTGWRNGIIPQTYEEFIDLFARIYIGIRDSVIQIPDEHHRIFMDILNIQKTSEISPEEIAIAVRENPNPAFPFIRNVYIGGNSSSDESKFNAMVKTLKMCAQNDVFIKAEKGIYIDLYGGLQLYIIENLQADMLMQVINAESVDKLSIKNNATSMVSVLLLDGVPEFEKIVFTGDATVHTFYQMLLDINTDIEQGKPIIYQDATWTAPHHGAHRTIHGEIPNDQEGREVFPHLLEVAHPTKMVVSAGVNNIHGHPCQSFMECVSKYMEEKVLQTMPQHFVYRNRNNHNKAVGAKWEFAPTNLPLYTTYTILENGSEGYMNYEFSFPPRNAVPAENMLLLENREEPAGRVFGSTTIPVKAEIPSKSMFFHR